MQVDSIANGTVSCSGGKKQETRPQDVSRDVSLQRWMAVGWLSLNNHSLFTSHVLPLHVHHVCVRHHEPLQQPSISAKWREWLSQGYQRSPREAVALTGRSPTSVLVAAARTSCPEERMAAFKPRTQFRSYRYDIHQRPTRGPSWLSPFHRHTGGTGGSGIGDDRW